MSKVVGTPDPPAPYRTRQVFPRLKFSEPVAMTWAPGSNRLLLVERRGKLYTFENSPTVEKADLLLDVNGLGNTTYGAAFHPDFQTNGYIYVMYVVDDKNPEPKGSRVSRFQVGKERPWRCDPKSEKVLLEWPSGGHNAGCLVFGKDGYLYLSCGDGSGIADELQTGQDVGDLLACLVRIDVDHPSGTLPYGIPKDNPFVNTAGARPELWAYGLRQV